MRLGLSLGLGLDLGVLESPQLGQHEGEHGDGRDEEDHEGLHDRLGKAQGWG